jgi:hypothetical protein
VSSKVPIGHHCLHHGQTISGSVSLHRNVLQ